MAEEKKSTSTQIGFGMKLHSRVRSELRRLNIGPRTAVSIVFQQKQKRWVIAGEEGGGAADKIGHYVGYVGVAPEGLVVSIPIQSLIPNVAQRRVIGQELVRVEAFRYETSCQFAITHYYLVSPGEGRRPELRSRELFRAYNGILNSDSKQPVFFDRAGEPIDLPAELVPSIQAASRGILTARNKRAHLIPVPAVILSPVEEPKEQSPEVSIEGLPPVEAVELTEPETAKPTKARSRATAKPVEPQEREVEA